MIFCLIKAFSLLQHDNELFYKFSPVLMQQIPKDTVSVWKLRSLDPRKLIPALVTHEQQMDASYVCFEIRLSRLLYRSHLTRLESIITSKDLILLLCHV